MKILEIPSSLTHNEMPETSFEPSTALGSSRPRLSTNNSGKPVTSQSGRVFKETKVMAKTTSVEGTVESAVTKEEMNNATV